MCLLIVQLLVSNHGIPSEVIEGALTAAKDFFALPLETKMEVLLSPHPIISLPTFTELD